MTDSSSSSDDSNNSRIHYLQQPPTNKETANIPFMTQQQRQQLINVVLAIVNAPVDIPNNIVKFPNISNK